MWKNLRSQITQENTGSLESLCKSWFELVDSSKSFPLLNAPFVSAWNVTLPENETPRAVRVSCLKWETVCLLPRSIIVNLDTFLNKPEADGNQDRLSSATACAQRAIDELVEWRERGNLNSWEEGSDFIPLEIDISFFETLHSSCRLLYELCSLSKMEQGEAVLGTGGLLLSLIKRAERLADDGHAPAALECFTAQLADAVDVGISQMLVKCAFECRVLPPNKTTWSEIGYWQERVIRVKQRSSSAFGKTEEMKYADAQLQTISRLNELPHATFSEPRMETLGFELHFEFPYKP
jgi:hypothetical protein